MYQDDETSIELRAESLARNHRMLMRKLVKIREDHGLTQTEVASRMGVSQPTVAAFERYDSNPTLATIRRYAVAVGARIEGGAVDDYTMPGWERLPNRQEPYVDSSTLPAPTPVGRWVSRAGALAR